MKPYVMSSYLDPIAKMWGSAPPAYAGGVSRRVDGKSRGKMSLATERSSREHVPPEKKS